KKLRQVLCDSASEPRYIETLPRLGYRFIAPVETAGAPQRRKTDVAQVANPTPPATFEPAMPETAEFVPGRRFRVGWLGLVSALLFLGAVLSFWWAGKSNWPFSSWLNTGEASAAANVRPIHSIA